MLATAQAQDGWESWHRPGPDAAPHEANAPIRAEVDDRPVWTFQGCNVGCEFGAARVVPIRFAARLRFHCRSRVLSHEIHVAPARLRIRAGERIVQDEVFAPGQDETFETSRRTVERTLVGSGEVRIEIGFEDEVGAGEYRVHEIGGLELEPVDRPTPDRARLAATFDALRSDEYERRAEAIAWLTAHPLDAVVAIGIARQSADPDLARQVAAIEGAWRDRGFVLLPPDDRTAILQATIDLPALQGY